MKPAFVSIYIYYYYYCCCCYYYYYSGVSWGKSWEIISKSKKNNNEGPFLTKECRS